MTHVNIFLHTNVVFIDDALFDNIHELNKYLAKIDGHIAKRIKSELRKSYCPEWLYRSCHSPDEPVKLT